MDNQKIQTNEPHISKAIKKCEVLYTIFIALFILNIFVSLVLVSLCLIPLFGSDNTELNLSLLWVNVCVYLVTGVIFGLILWLITRIFRDVTRKKEPFSTVQITRMRRIALLLVVFALIDFTLTSGFFNPSVMFDISLGFSFARGLGEPLISPYIGALIAAAGVYGLSAIFEYGVELQHQSDEIL